MGKMMMIAKYTEVLKNILEEPHTKELLDEVMSEYPLYESTSERKYGQPNIVPTREELNQAIFNHYKYREIGFETIGRFIDELGIAMKEIMPYYNQLYYSADQDYNVIYNVDYVKTINRDRDNTMENTSSGTIETSDSLNTQSTSTGESGTTSSTTSDEKNVFSDTPQGLLDIGTTGIDSVNYATNVSWDENVTSGQTDSSTSTTANSTNTSSGETTNENTMNGTANEQEQIIEETKGNYGVVSAQDLIIKYREQIRNITQELINDPRINELFMLVY